jgi:hypothetical protein
MNMLRIGLTLASVAAFAAPAHAAKLSIRSDDCGSPPLSQTVGVSFGVNPFFDPFPSLDPFLTFNSDDGTVTGCSQVYDDPFFGPDTSMSALTLRFAGITEEFIKGLTFDPTSQFDVFSVNPATGALIFSGRLPIEFSADHTDLAIVFYDCSRSDTAQPVVTCGEFPSGASAITFESVAVPEPAVLLLASTGAAMMLRRRRRPLRV